jgi:hypothetical protein
VLDLRQSSFGNTFLQRQGRRAYYWTSLEPPSKPALHCTTLIGLKHRAVFGRKASMYAAVQHEKPFEAEPPPINLDERTTRRRHGAPTAYRGKSRGPELKKQASPDVAPILQPTRTGRFPRPERATANSRNHILKPGRFYLGAHSVAQIGKGWPGVANMNRERCPIPKSHGVAPSDRRPHPRSICIKASIFMVAKLEKVSETA